MDTAQTIAEELRRLASPMIAPCPKHKVIPPDCVWCFAYDVDTDWIERLMNRANQLDPKEDDDA